MDFALEYAFYVYLFLNNFYKVRFKQYVLFSMSMCHHFGEYKHTETVIKFPNQETLPINVLKKGYL